MVDKVINISIDHILLFIIVVFLFYHFLGNCDYIKEINGFSVGGTKNPCCEGSLCNDNCIDISDLNLYPDGIYTKIEYAYTYDKHEKKNKWTLTKDKRSNINENMKSILDKLLKLNVILIGVKRVNGFIFDYEIHLAVNSSDSSHYIFYDNSGDDYNLYIDSYINHYLDYNSDKPKLTYLLKK